MTTAENQQGQSQGVLTGIRVLDLAGLAGQYAGRLLADLGADVIKIEPPGGDPVRSMPPFADDKPGPDRSLRWLAYNSNKSSVVLDINSDSGRQSLLEMARLERTKRNKREIGGLTKLAVRRLYLETSTLLHTRGRVAHSPR